MFMSSAKFGGFSLVLKSCDGPLFIYLFNKPEFWGAQVSGFGLGSPSFFKTSEVAPKGRWVFTMENCAKEWPF